MEAEIESVDADARELFGALPGAWSGGFCSGEPRKGNGIKGAGMECPGFCVV